jgi:hydroxyacylglutathione hydrolase
MSDRLEVFMFPCLSDNYGYLIHDPIQNLTASIDTPDVHAIEEALNQNNWELDYIINTHHHYDHAGGNLELKKKTNCKIIGPMQDKDRIPGIDQTIEHAEEFMFGSFTVKGFHTPGHTTGHMVYHFEDQNIAFVGDTIFAMGCGRLFEGTPEQMLNSLDIIMSWPGETMLYCAHEYTQSNAEFAITVDGKNEDLLKRKSEVDALREKLIPTVPTKLEIEKKTNPFLRSDDKEIRLELGMMASSRSEVFAEIRSRKDQF